MKIQPGTMFATYYEGGPDSPRSCIATTAPDARGDFEGIDSDGVLCRFNISMVMGFPALNLARRDEK